MKGYLVGLAMFSFTALTCAGRTEHWDASPVTGRQQRNLGVNVVYGIQHKVWVAAQKPVLFSFSVHCVHGLHMRFWQNPMKVVLQGFDAFAVQKGDRCGSYFRLAD